ncbi:hypothetical protein AN414_19235 [Serratia marcescens]|nr:hypothetical protein AN414_19235 [Serratia marcescens]
MIVVRVPQAGIELNLRREGVTPTDLNALQRIGFRERLVDALAQRVHLGVNHAGAPALAVVQHQLYAAGQHLAVAAHGVAQRVTLLIITASVNVVVVDVVFTTHIRAGI